MAVKAKGALGAVISAAISAFLIYWLVTNGITWGSKEVNEEVTKTAPAMVQAVTENPAALLGSVVRENDTPWLPR